MKYSLAQTVLGSSIVKLGHRPPLVVALTIALAAGTLWAKEPSAKEREGIFRGPLKMSADETVSKEKGGIIEAMGNVQVKYEMESGDVLESHSGFARYNEKEGTGEVWGQPKAYWRRSDPSDPETRLIADKILIKIKDSELHAAGNVLVIQSSSTLAAENIAFYNRQKRMTADGGRPEFKIRQARHNTRISAKRITAWTEKKEIQFSEKVRGEVVLRPEGAPAHPK